MANTKQPNKAKSDAVPTSTELSLDVLEQDWNPGQGSESYVVTRGGFRVSDNEYLTPDWPAAIVERDFWQRAINYYPDGTKAEIVKYNNKKHKTFYEK